MAGNVRPILDEKDGLLAFLAQQREALRFAVQGLSDEQAASRPTVSALSLAGLIKHAANTERGWIVGIMCQREAGQRDWATEFRLVDGESLAGVLALYDEVARETMAAAGMQLGDIDWLIPHQANVRILEATARKLGLPLERLVVTVDHHGNTSAASVPLALDEFVRAGKIRPGHRVLLQGVGGGFTWGATLVTM